MKTLSVRLDDAELAALSKLSEALGKSRSQLVKRSISALAQPTLQGPSPHDMAEKLELIGSFRGRANLSENVALHVMRKLLAESARSR